MTAEEKRMRLRYACICRLCGAALDARTEAIYERPAKTVRCLDCSPAAPVVEVRAERASKPPSAPIDVGTPGASARREYERRIPGTRANIDHIAVTPTGVYVIDTKRYAGQRPASRIEGGVLRPRVEKLMVGGRDRTKLVDGVLKQVDVVHALLDGAVPVTGVLCFVDADRPLIGGAFTIRGVEVQWPRRLCQRLSRSGPHAQDVASTARALSASLPPA